ncbi:MAG: hypothetical protein EPO26_09045 [Chloroflexota bacterium]|nr:MAG: hypothetical protein EPO26_09045 [Chloroflexota bacterium]
MVALTIAVGLACRPSIALSLEPDSLFPLRLGAVWYYETRLTGPTTRTATTEVAVCGVQTDEDGDDLYFIATCVDNDFVEAQIVYRIGDEVIEPISFGADGRPRPRDPPIVLLRTRMAPGETWRWDESDGDNRHESMRATNWGRVRTPMGDVNAIRVYARQEHITGGYGAIERWYSPGIGMVKESGSLMFPTEGGIARIDLVRILVRHDERPPSQITCCGKLPSGMMNRD